MKTREQLEATGNKILNSVRTELYLSMRFMGPALGSLGFAMDLSTRTVGTDAVYIRFNPTYLLQTYIERPEILNRTYAYAHALSVPAYVFRKTARGCTTVGSLL